MGKIITAMSQKAMEIKNRLTTTEPAVADPIIQQIYSIELQRDYGWRVILFNDDFHGMDEVVLQIQKATGFSLEKAEAIMFEAHSTGQAIVIAADLERCTRVAGVLQQIGLNVTVEEN